MGLKKTLKRDGDYVELYYNEILLGAIKLDISNRTTQADLFLDLKREIKIVSVKKKREEKQIDEDFGNR